MGRLLSWLSVAFVVWLALAVALIVYSVRAHAHDDGRYADSNLKAWFDGLSSGNGACCSFADGVAIEDVDWDMEGINADGTELRYRVRINGDWVVVPPEAVITEPNKFGRAVVWPYQAYGGVTKIRCFIPGTAS